MDIQGIMDICDGYIQQAEKLEKEKKPTDGLFGMGKKPADDPCHDKFASDMEKALDELAKEEHPSGEIKDILSYIYHLPAEHRQPMSIFWMLCAVHGLTLALTDKLSPEDKTVLCTQYGTDFKRWERLPAQEQVYKKLKKAK